MSQDELKAVIELLSKLTEEDKKELIRFLIALRDSDNCQMILSSSGTDLR